MPRRSCRVEAARTAPSQALAPAWFTSAGGRNKGQQPDVRQCVAPDRRRILTARTGSILAGWVVLNRDPSPLIAHWGTVNHLQTHPAYRDLGNGLALMDQLRHVARNEMGLEQLHLAARGGTGLEGFYTRLGWREIGRWPGKLRLAPGDTRDEILMILAPL
jgi:GNAT superfamily N-acetyltransferase